MTRVLLVDDHPLVRRGLRGAIEAELQDAAFAEAGDVSAALAELDRAPFDLIILDLDLPGRDGLSLLEELQRRGGPPRIVLSGLPEEAFAVRCLKLGASAFLDKATGAGEILAAMRKVLAGGRFVSTSLAESLAAALGGDLRHAPHEALSGRELQVLRMVARARTIKEISAELHLSESTVATYRSRIAQKLGLSSNVELTRYALQHRLAD
jgi:DNA-binding NarL/FixJ family response regulator